MEHMDGASVGDRMESMKNVLEEKESEVDYLSQMNAVLVTKERIANDELQEARKEMITESQMAHPSKLLPVKRRRITRAKLEPLQKKNTVLLKEFKIPDRCPSVLDVLPDHILSMIFAGIPTEEAAKSEMVWCRPDLWALSPTVDIEQVPSRTWLDEQEPLPVDSWDAEAIVERRKRLIALRKKMVQELLDTYLTHHEGVIERLKLQYVPEPKDEEQTHKLIRRMFEKDTKHIELDFRVHSWELLTYMYPFPLSSMMQTTSLTTFILRGVSLRGCDFGMKELVNLQKVVLDKVEDLSLDEARVILSRFKDIKFRRLHMLEVIDSKPAPDVIITNPNMQSLKIINCSGPWLKKCHIFTTSLREFKIKGQKIDFSLEDAQPHMQKAFISIHSDFNNNDFRKLLNQMTSVRSLVFSFDISQPGWRGWNGPPVEEAIPFKEFQNLTELIVILGGVSYQTLVHEIKQKAPNLQEYQVMLKYYWHYYSEKQDTRLERMSRSEYF